MNELEQSVPGGVLTTMGVVAAGALTWIGQRLYNRRREASEERAEVASDNARADTYEMLQQENGKLLQRALEAERRAGEEFIKRCSCEADLKIVGRSLDNLRRLIAIGATNEQVQNFFAESSLAEFADEPQPQTFRKAVPKADG